MTDTDRYIFDATIRNAKKEMAEEYYRRLFYWGWVSFMLGLLGGAAAVAWVAL